METSRGNYRAWFWMWVGFAFILGAAVGVVLALSTVSQLVAPLTNR